MAYRAARQAANKVDDKTLKITKTVADDARDGGDVVCMIYHNDLLISGGDNGKIKIWTPDLALEATIEAHPVNVYSLTAINDTIYSCSNDGTVKAWNMGTWDFKKLIMENQESEVIKVCSDSGILYAGNDRGDLFVFKDEELIATYFLHEDIADLLVLGPLVFNARNVDVSVTEMMGGPRFNYMSRGAMIGRFPVKLVGDKICFLSRCAKQIYIHMCTKEDKFKRLAEIKAHDMTITAMSHVNGKPNVMVSGGYDRVVKAWDMNSKKRLGQIDVGVCINDICAGPEGQIFVSSGDGLIVRVDFMV